MKRKLKYSLLLATFGVVVSSFLSYGYIECGNPNRLGNFFDFLFGWLFSTGLTYCQKLSYFGWPWRIWIKNIPNSGWEIAPASKYFLDSLIANFIFYFLLFTFIFWILGKIKRK